MEITFIYASMHLSVHGNMINLCTETKFSMPGNNIELFMEITLIGAWK